MATPFAINTGSTISGTTQIGDIAVGDTAQDYSSGPGGVQWWMGPDDDIGFVVTRPDLAFGHTSPAGGNAGLSFRRSSDLTQESYLDLANSLSIEDGGTGFTNTVDADTWMGSQGYYTSFVFETEATDLFARMDVQPSKRLKDLINKTIVDLKTEEIWDLDDVRYQLNLHTAQASNLNWISNGFDVGPVNSPIHILFEGYSGNSISYLRTYYTPSVNAVNYALNDAGMGISTSNEELVFKYLISSRSTSGDIADMHSLTGGIAGRMNGNTSTDVDVVYGTTEGVFDVQRTASSGMTGYAEGIETQDVPVAVGIVPTREIWLMALQNIGSRALSSLNTMNYARIGASLTPAQLLRNVEIVRYFNDNVYGTYDFGGEQILNGSFDGDTGWTYPAGWVIEDGVAKHSNAYNAVALYQTCDITAGSYYMLEWDILPLAEPTGGTRNMLLIWNSAGQQIFGDNFRSTRYGHTGQIYEALYSATQIRFNGYNVDGNDSRSFSMDNITLKEVTNYDG